MSHLLLKPTFDKFSFIEGEITTFNTYTIDGYIQKEFFEDAPIHTYSYWSDLRDFCFSLIKGKRTPLGFKFILSLSQEEIAEFLLQQNIDFFNSNDIQGLYLNIKYDGTNLQCVTGTSLKIFTLDKSVDKAWDEYVKAFFSKQGIEWEIGQ